MKILVKREQSQTGLNFDEREKIGLKVKRLFQWVMAAILICGATTFTSCTNEDNPVNPVDNLSEKILGTWVDADINGKTALTNEKSVTTFLSATKAINSQSRVDFTPTAPRWNANLEFDVQISGNKVTLTGHPNDSITLVKEYNITAVNDSEMYSDYKHTTYCDGRVILLIEAAVRYVKVPTDYREAILGTWEGHCTSEGSEFDDGQEHRWQYNADGTYVYYVKDGDNWEPYEGTTLSEYFVDGNLLCTRWIDQGQENREWWEITISGDQMVWTALRQNADGSTFTATFEMKKVE